MNNIAIEVGAENILVLRIDLKKGNYPTNSGRSVMIGTTGGNLLLWRDGKPDPLQIKVNCSVFRPFTTDEQKAIEEAQKKRREYR
jgi:hypothetical protein